MTIPYEDPILTDDPATGESILSTWGRRIRQNQVGFDAPPACKGVMASAMPLSSAVVTVVEFDGANIWDTDGFHDPSGANTRFTVPAGLGGRYLVEVQIPFSLNSSGYRGLQLQVSGGTPLINNTDLPIPAVHVMQSTGELDLGAGDYVEVLAYQNSGVTLDVGVNPYQYLGWLTLRRVSS